MIGERWGVTDEEVAQPYPCDAWIDRPTFAAWRGVTVHAPAADVWPWVSQIRLAPYSYDWVDNGGRRSPRTLVDLPEATPGEPFTRTAGRAVGRILSVEPQHQLTGRIGGVVMSYVLSPYDGGSSTRLLLKLVAQLPRVWGPALTLGDLPMARRQLLTWKRLAETTRAASGA